jgi:hypothetical protein
MSKRRSLKGMAVLESQHVVELETACFGTQFERYRERPGSS